MTTIRSQMERAVAEGRAEVLADLRAVQEHRARTSARGPFQVLRDRAGRRVVVAARPSVAELRRRLDRLERGDRGDDSLAARRRRLDRLTAEVGAPKGDS